MNIAKELRTDQCHLFLTDQERAAITEKMKQAGITNLSAYIRKMAIDGYVLKLDLPEMKEMISLMRYSSNNLNQIAKKANEGGEVTRDDLKDIEATQDRIWKGINRILKRLGEIP